MINNEEQRLCEAFTIMAPHVLELRLVVPMFSGGTKGGGD